MTMKQNFRMIDVGEKSVTKRRALAKGSISVASKTIAMIKDGTSPKGNILAIAEVAGIMAAKNTSQLLPLCHPLLLDSVRIWYQVNDSEVIAHCEVICHARTGVEMEALVGVNVCLLTIYDLAKAVDPVIEISNVYLDTKEGGKTGTWRHPRALFSLTPKLSHQESEFAALRFAVGTLSDRASTGDYVDESGPLLTSFFNTRGSHEIFYSIIPDEKEAIIRLVKNAIEGQADVLLFTGGTGISERDITPEVVRELSSKELVGFGELQRAHGAQFTSSSWLSRSSAFIVQKTLVILFPGSPKAVRQGLECIGGLIPHAIRMMRGESHHDHPIHYHAEQSL